MSVGQSIRSTRPMKKSTFHWSVCRAVFLKKVCELSPVFLDFGLTKTIFSGIIQYVIIDVHRIM